MFLAMTVPALLYGGLALTIPESPRYLVSRMRLGEAKDVLRRVLGNIDVDAKVEEIRQTLSSERAPKLADLRGPALGLLPIVWVGIGLSVFQQFVGINVIFYYSSVLWQAVGFSENSSLVITVITSVVNIVTTLVAIALIDRVGRKPLLLVGSAGMALTLGIMAVIFGAAPTDAHGAPALHGALGPTALVSANAFVFFFGMSWGPVVWVMLGEKFPNRIRAAALSVLGLGAMDRQLGDHHQFSFAEGRRTRLGLRHLCRVCGAVICVRSLGDHGDERPRARGDARTGHSSAGSQGAT